jgi:hypothetical protein
MQNQTSQDQSVFRWLDWILRYTLFHGFDTLGSHLGKKGPLTTMGDLSSCKSKRTLIRQSAPADPINNSSVRLALLCERCRERKESCEGDRSDPHHWTISHFIFRAGSETLTLNSSNSTQSRLHLEFWSRATPLELEPSQTGLTPSLLSMFSCKNKTLLNTHTELNLLYHQCD